LLRRSDIKREGPDLGAAYPQFVRRLLCGFRIYVAEDNRGAFACKSPHNSQANPACATGNHGHLTVKSA
jgi:hypothetical protein